jgi:hypothetical protein
MFVPFAPNIPTGGSMLHIRHKGRMPHDSYKKEAEDMTGWMIIFALTSTTSGVWGRVGQAPIAFFVSVLFGTLFLLALCARSVRGAVC